MSRHKADPSRADEVVVMRALQGRRPSHRLNDHDRAGIVDQMARRNYSDGQIAWALDSPRRSVLRIRTRLSIPPGLPSGSNQGHLVHPDYPIRPGRD